MAGNDGKKDAPAMKQDAYVSKMRPDPAAAPASVMVLEGLIGDSHRDGWGRLYFNRALTSYAEFKLADAVFSEEIPADQSPLAGMVATRVGVAQDAVVEYTRTTRAKPQDEFDLDIRLASGAGSSQAQALPLTNSCPAVAHCVTQLTCATDCFTKCNDQTCHTCQTRCHQATCQTCQTQCNQATCNATCQTCQTKCGQATCNATCQTCQTQCGQATCQTCNTCATQCNQATCHTCQTRCNQDTCHTCNTCDTCNPHVFTCGPNPQCRPQ